MSVVFLTSIIMLLNVYLLVIMDITVILLIIYV